MTTNFPTVMPTNDLATALSQSQVQQTNENAGMSFLKMDFETGEWLLGQSQSIVTDEEILIFTDSIGHGWILWSGGRPQKHMVRFNQPLPAPMAAVGTDTPSEGRTFQAVMMDDQEQIAFDTNSYGGRKGVDALLAAIKTHAAEESEFLYPKVKLTSESYANKQRGGKLVYNPVFQILAWCKPDGTEEGGKVAQVEDKTKAPAAEEALTRQRRSSKKNAA